MGKSMIEKVYECFNNQDLEGFMKFFHKDFKYYNLKTGELLVDNIEEVYESNKEPVLNKDKILYANNVVVRGNIELFYKTFSYKNVSQVVMCEFEDGLIKNVWGATYEGV